MNGQTARSQAIHASAANPHYLYRCYDAEGRLLYIGCSDRPQRRLSHHRNGLGQSVASKLLARHLARFEVDETPHRDREAGRQAEAEAIYAEQPLFNAQGRCIPLWFIQLQIADYEAGREVGAWPEPIHPSPRLRAS